MSKNRGKVSLEPEAVGKQKVNTLLPKFSFKIAVPIQHLPDHRLW